MKGITLEIFRDICEENGLDIDKEKSDSIAKTFLMHLDTEKDMEAIAHKGNGECYNCIELQRQLKRLQNDNIRLADEIDIYQENVKIRRKCTRVWIENRTVMYDYR